jgi:hypothetical protein
MNTDGSRRALKKLSGAAVSPTNSKWTDQVSFSLLTNSDISYYI